MHIIFLKNLTEYLKQIKKIRDLIFLVFYIKLHKTSPFILVVVHSLAANFSLKIFSPHGNLFCIDQIKADLAFPKETVQILVEEYLIFKLASFCSIIHKK